MPTGTIERDDVELAHRFHRADPAAIREVYQRFSGPLLSLSRSMLADREQARDAVQQTFLQAWKAADRFDPSRPLSSWLYQICRRVCIDRYRQDHRAQDALTATGEVADVADVVVDGVAIDQTWVVWEVRQAIDELPVDEREVVRLFHLEGWSLPQIADRLGLPLGTVKSRSFRAHKKLAAALAHVRAGADDEQVA
jgi:RNA polymerase sigma-70 factor (ECF subfamily)